MSGLAAAFRLDGGPAPGARLRVMLDRAAHRGPDGAAVRSAGSGALGLLYQRLHPEDPVASEPAYHSETGIVVAFDGRLDNRDELAAIFGWRGTDRAPEDSAYAAEAFARWGADAATRLAGDFAVVAWQAGERRVIAARDRLGIRPLHWAIDGSVLLLASDPAQIAAALASRPRPDPVAVAALLSGEPPSAAGTLLANIGRVPPGHVLTVEHGGARTRGYWQPESAGPPPRLNDGEWADACRDHLDRAVGRRLRARGPVSVFFSGGIDSSAVLAVAARIGRRPVAPITLTFDEPQSDERAHARAVLAHLRLNGTFVPAAPVRGEAFVRQAAARCALPDLPADLAGMPLKIAARRAGASLALTGVGGDSLFSGSTFAYADHLARGRVDAAVARFALDRVTDASGWTRSGLLTSGVWPLLRVPLRRRLRARARRLIGAPVRPSWLRLEPPPRPVVPDPPPGVSRASWELVWSMRDGWTSLFVESSERAASEAGIVERHPLLDADLVQFALSLPEAQRRRGRTTKFVLRGAVPELPPAVAGRRDKADFSHVVLAALADLGGRRFFTSLAIGDAGWVDASQLADRYDRLTLPGAAATADGGRDVPTLWMVAATELWFRAMHGQPAYAISEGAAGG